ncbi:MAG: hypothetical protein R3324_21500, partial [Halobacteriales archaeon]|nr:hypothetical protein [Halobacteriales archaeon]
YGLGFFLREQDPFTVIDLDGVIGEDGIEEWAAGVVERADSYTEVSPSGTGLHIWLRGAMPEGVQHNNGEGFEMYDRGRYMTVTGRVWPRGSKARPVREDQATIDALAEDALPAADEPTTSPWDALDRDGSREGGALGDLAVSDLYPDLPLGQRVAHPIHGSKTGSNFMVRAPDGDLAICWHGGHAYGSGEGCGLAACHLLAMEVTGETDCAAIRERWKSDDGLAFETWKYAIEEGYIEPQGYSRALCYVAREAGYDPDPEDRNAYRHALETARLICRHKHGIDLPDHS